MPKQTHKKPPHKILPFSKPDDESTSTQMVLSTLNLQLKKMLALCDCLEKIADDLPANFDRQHCLAVSRSLVPMVKQAHAFEEQVLFPIILKLRKSDETIKPIFERLQWEHIEDEDYGAEVSEALIDLVAGSLTNIEKLSYMLRGFFEGMRRHIAFEREHILPLLRT